MCTRSSTLPSSCMWGSAVLLVARWSSPRCSGARDALFGREGRTVHLHGARASRLLKPSAGEAGGEGGRSCLTRTLVGALVLARSLFHHSMNHRSAVTFGRGRMVEDEAERMHALEVIAEQTVPGRWPHARVSDEQELRATAIVAIEMEMATAKVRATGTGGGHGWPVVSGTRAAAPRLGSGGGR